MTALVSARALANPTAAMAMILMAVIAMMILPVPAWILDVGLAVSFALAILVFTVTLFIEKPLDFSAFPMVLLASLVLRLAMNVSSTKLIIGEGHTGTDAAGHVIEGFASFVMGGNIFLGLVVFGVLLIVNFMVIAKGAARMAEVGARFALDGMPGKQLAIDSDMSAGAISHEQARARREQEQQETAFFGSLDGASKFVKGDAVAGLLITVLNLVMGLIMGVAVHGMPFGDAFHTYSVLTVGDGLVTQIPAVIVSIAAALLLSRGGNSGSVDFSVVSQLGGYPAALATVALLMTVFAFVPGLPFVPFMASALVLGYAVFLGSRSKKAQEDQLLETPAPEQVQRPLGDLIDLDDIHVEFSADLVAMVLDPATGLDVRVTNMRSHVARTFGLILPEIRLTDQETLDPGQYLIRIQGVEQARGTVHPDMVLALLPDDGTSLPDGVDVREPVYGARARWLPMRDKENAVMAGYTVVTAPEILATHLLEVIKRNLARLLTLKSLRKILTELGRVSDPVRAEANKKLIEELIPDRVPIEVAQSVLKLLLDEQVSIRNLPVILEAIGEARVFTTQAEGICEHVRQRLGFQIVGGLKREDGSVPLVQLAPEWEEVFLRYQTNHERGPTEVALPPDDFGRLVKGLRTTLADVEDRGVHAALVTSMPRRRFLRTVLQSQGLPIHVLSFEEIGTEARPSLVGVVEA